MTTWWWGQQLSAVTKANEERDRRRIRRSFTDDELARLLEVAAKRGRRAWYLTAALAGARFSDLGRLLWIDVDFDAGTLLIRDGKSGHDDLLPLHPDLAIELAARKAAQKGKPHDRVFPTIMDGRTRLNDFFAAGLAERVNVLNADGSIKMRWHGKGRSRRQVPKTKLVVKKDATGRVVDLHALRTTLGTNLARSGVAPQVAQKIMRHADYRTTLKHYTDLQLADSASALGSVRVPASVAPSDSVQSAPETRTAVQTAVGTATTVLFSSALCDPVRSNGSIDGTSPMKNRPVKSSDFATPCDSILPDSGKRVKGFEPSTFSLEG